MELLSSTWLVALVAFIIGAGIGILIFKGSHSDEVKIRKLEDDLEQKEHDMELYRQSVTAHFSRTSELVNNLTENYVEVYKHLAEGSETLVDPKNTPPLLGKQQANTLVSFINEAEEQAETDKEESPVEPPKDYAAKKAEEESETEETKTETSKA